jgi:glycosyltransferase involved in cell wall biosynthesis
VPANLTFPRRTESPQAGGQEQLALAVAPVHVAFLALCIVPYTLPVLQFLAASVRCLQVLVSVPMETDRHWAPDWGGLDVRVQRTLTFTRRRTYKQGFNMTSFLHFPLDTLKLLRRFRPDVIISAQLGFRTMQALLYRLLNPACRLIIWADLSEHTEQGVGRLKTAMRRLFLRAADAILVNGSSGARYLKSLGVTAEKLVVAPYVADSHFNTKLSAKDPQIAKRLLYVGQLIERKGLEPFLHSLSRWLELHKSEPREMWIVGDGPLRRRLEHMRVSPRLLLKFFDNVPYHNLTSFYASAGVFVLPTLADTWGLVVNEAMAAGLPIFGSLYSQAVEELVVNGKNGWTFFPDRPAQFLQSLEEMLTCPLHALAQMGEAARATVEELTPSYLSSRFLHVIRVATGQDL